MNRQTEDPCGPGKLIAPSHSIRLRSAIPGPHSQAIQHRARAITGRPYPAPIVIDKAHGTLVYDVDGNVFIDFACNLIVGHTPEGMVNAAAEQADRAQYIPDRFAISEDAVRLCELINTITPEMRGPKQTLLFGSDDRTGTFLEDDLIVLAKAFTQRGSSFGFAGETDLTRWFANMLTSMLTSPNSMACVYLDWGYKPFSEGFLQDIQRYCQATQTLFLSNECLSGFGRTGQLFAAQHSDWQPDMVITYGMGCNVPIAALTIRADILKAEDAYPRRGSLTHLDPVHVRSALWAIQHIQAQNFAGRAVQLGELVAERTAEWGGGFTLIGKAGMQALEFPTAERCDQVVAAALHNGLLLQRDTPTRIPLAFPLMIPEEQLNEGLDVLETILTDPGF
jgi:4-aminobutyrate aminotransferase/(S)-3-amino-2-methylpropionate transaminase